MRELNLVEVGAVSGGVTVPIASGDDGQGNTWQLSVQAGLNYVIVNVTGAFTDLGQWGDYFANSVVPAIGQSVVDAGNAVTGFFSTIADYVSSAWDYITELFYMRSEH